KVLVADAKTAQIQADTIKDHTLGKFGPYSKMSREDPNRATYINGLVLRNALTIARMSLNLSDMVVGLGVTLILAGFAITGSGVVLLGIGKQGQYSAGTGGRVSG
ncbi:MAG: hypothetical protein HYY09_05625, partial [Firmicutes bacterium]|nr:hypothetical protein [Bacillota bacterium]